MQRNVLHTQFPHLDKSLHHRDTFTTVSESTLTYTGVVHSMGFDKYTTAYIHHHSIAQNSFIPFKILSIHPLITHSTFPVVATCLYTICIGLFCAGATQLESYSMCPFHSGSFHLTHTQNSLMSFHELAIHMFVVVNNNSIIWIEEFIFIFWELYLFMSHECKSSVHLVKYQGAKCLIHMLM